MNENIEFPFERARRVTPEENLHFRKALQEQFGKQLRERKPLEKDKNED